MARRLEQERPVPGSAPDARGSIPPARPVTLKAETQLGRARIAVLNDSRARSDCCVVHNGHGAQDCKAGVAILHAQANGGHLMVMWKQCHVAADSGEAEIILGAMPETHRIDTTLRGHVSALFALFMRRGADGEMILLLSPTVEDYVAILPGNWVDSLGPEEHEWFGLYEDSRSMRLLGVTAAMGGAEGVALGVNRPFVSKLGLHIVSD